MKIDKIKTIETLVSVENYNLPYYYTTSTKDHIPQEIIRKLNIEVHLINVPRYLMNKIKKLYLYPNIDTEDNNIILNIYKFIFSKKFVWYENPLPYLLKPRIITTVNADFLLGTKMGFDENKFNKASGGCIRLRRIINKNDNSVILLENLLTLLHAIYNNTIILSDDYLNILLDIIHEMESKERDR